MIIGFLLIALLLLGCRVLWHAAIVMRPRVQELRAERRQERQRRRAEIQQQRQEWRDYLGHLRETRLRHRAARLGPPLKFGEKIEAIFWAAAGPAIVLLVLMLAAR
jgi:hypothetical protein